MRLSLKIQFLKRKENPLKKISPKRSHDRISKNLKRKISHVEHSNRTKKERSQYKLLGKLDLNKGRPQIKPSRKEVAKNSSKKG